MKKEKHKAEQAEQPDIQNVNTDNAEAAEQNAESAEPKTADETGEQSETNEPEAEPSPEEALARLAAAYAELEKANQKLTDEKQALAGQLTRLQADFDNFRRRTRTEKEDWQKNNTAAFCGELLPVIDNFGRALQALKAGGQSEPGGQGGGHVAGVEMIARQLAELLAAKGVERIPAIGEDFDPNWHEAIGQTQVEDDALVGKVTEEIQSGYKIGDKLLRVAMVHVGTK